MLAIEPTHAAALAGRARAERLPEVQELVQRANVEVARGELMAALSTYREALAIDADWPAAHAGVAEVNRMLRDAEFERLLSAGFGLLGAEDFAAARREFEAALAMRPGSREAADGLAQAEEGAKLEQIALAEVRGARIRAARAVGRKRSSCIAPCSRATARCCSRRRGSSELEARAGLDAKLVNLIDNPTLLFGDAVLADARALLDDGARPKPKKGRVSRRRSRSSESSSSSRRSRSPCASNRIS